MINDDNTNTKSIIDYNDSELEGIRPAASASTITNNNTVNNVTSLNTSAINVDVNNSKGGNVIFVFEDSNAQNKEDNKLFINVNYALQHCPIIHKHLSVSNIKLNESNNVIVNLPLWISRTNVIEYFHYIDNPKKVIDFDYIALLKMSAFFKSFDIGNQLIHEVIKEISFSNAMMLLETAFEFLTSNEPCQMWIEMFVACLDYISKNLPSYLIHEGNKIYNLNSKLQNEIVMKYISNNQSKFFIVDNIVIDFIMKIKKCSTISDSIINEYLLSLNGDNINEIVTTAVTPALSLEIDLDSDDNVYLEIPIQNVLMNVTIIAVITYKKYDNFLNINLKVAQTSIDFFSCHNVLSFISVGFIDEGENKQIYLKTFSRNKNVINIYRQYIDSKKYFSPIKFNLYMKINFIHTALVNHFIYNYEKCYNEKNIHKIGQSLLSQILVCAKEKARTNKRIDNMLYASISDWLIDEVNIHIDENVKELLNCVEWNKVDIENIITFYIKFYDLIAKNGIKEIFIELINDKVKQFNVGDIIDRVSRNIDYVRIIDEIYKSKKENLNFGIGIGFKGEEISTINKSKIEKFMEDNVKIDSIVSKQYEISHESNFEIKRKDIIEKPSSQRSSTYSNLRIFSYNDIQIQSLVTSSEIRPNSATNTTNNVSSLNTMNTISNEIHYHKKAPAVTYNKYKNSFKISNKLQYNKNPKSIFSNRITQNNKISKHSFSGNRNSMTSLTNENSHLTKNTPVTHEYSKTQNSNSKISIERGNSFTKKKEKNKRKISTSSTKSVFQTNRSSSNIKVVMNSPISISHNTINSYNNNKKSKPKKGVKSLVFKDYK